MKHYKKNIIFYISRCYFTIKMIVFTFNSCHGIVMFLRKLNNASFSYENLMFCHDYMTCPLKVIRPQKQEHKEIVNVSFVRFVQREATIGHQNVTN